MATYVGNVLEAVRKRCFDYERAEIGVFAGEGPDLFRRSGITDMKQSVLFRFDKKSNRGHDMANRDSGNGMISDFGDLTFPHAAESQHGNALSWAGNARKVGPYPIVKKELGQSVNDVTDTPNVDGNFAFAVEIIGQGAKRHYVIQMDVSDQYIPNFFLRLEIQRRSGATRVNEKRIIDQKRGEIKTGKLPSRAP